MASGTRAVWLLPVLLVGVVVAGCAADQRRVVAAAAIERPEIGVHDLRAAVDGPSTRAIVTVGLAQTARVDLHFESRHRRASEASPAPRSSGGTDTGWVCQIHLSAAATVSQPALAR